ncbi:ribonuclease P protein component [Portibacter lacus]|uniref:Ribonuclease P protein component n=1 Tax=Portibacter lacus TaxID=1099794 RepID=A0AA37SQ26_9BACT|nr:ribonuclease P protein component [Portibacter lacus]GLR18796.1 ribonuclease P protein component [Portibacter lacus]
MANFSFPKSVRLTNKKKFELLFEESQIVKAFPLKIMFRLKEDTLNEPESPKFQFAFTVPKRSFKKAVDRNYLKRRMKEAFRLNKQLLEETLPPFYGIIIYTNREKQDFHAIEKAMIKALTKLNAHLSDI